MLNFSSDPVGVIFYGGKTSSWK